MTRQPNLPYFVVEYEFMHAAGYTAKYTVTVPAATADAACKAASDRMWREGTPMHRIKMLGATQK